MRVFADFFFQQIDRRFQLRILALKCAVRRIVDACLRLPAFADTQPSACPDAT